MSYEQFLATKISRFTPSGFDVDESLLNPSLFPFQNDIVKLALKLGKFCLWANTGLGKGLMLLSWSDAIVRHTDGKVLVLAPLGVAKQLVRESAKFNIQSPIKYALDDSEVTDGITVTNYDRLHLFDASQFIGVVLDESSVMKNSTSSTCQSIIDLFVETPYKLACSATPAPNDQMELGTQAEFIGVMRKVEMLAMFFTHDGGDTSKWVLKGHAKTRFWEWVATWAIVLRKPSDLGYDDDGYDLPELNVLDVVVNTPVDAMPGELFAWEAKSLSEQRALNKATLNDRIEATASLVSSSADQWLVWCETNDESARITKLIGGAVEVKGSDTNKHKEDSMMAFADGKIRVMVSKSSICGFGLNFQRCHNTVFVCSSHSFEKVYQSIRRFYRFGQTEAVNAYFVHHELEGAVQRNYQRKERDANAMYQSMMSAMMNVTMASLRGIQPDVMDYNPQIKMVVPEWLISDINQLLLSGQ